MNENACVLPSELNVKEYVLNLKNALKDSTLSFKNKFNRNPKLIIFNVNKDNEANQIYVRNKIKDCYEIGIDVEEITNIDNQKDLITNIIKYNMDKRVDGIMVQLPLPKQFDERTVLYSIAPNKDVDGLSMYNIGRLWANVDTLTPCTPQGILNYLRYINVNLDNANVVIIGRSNIVGKPMSNLMLQANANVTILHSHTSKENIKRYCTLADIIILATGQAKWFDISYLENNNKWPVIIDVGINRDENNKLCGDLNIQSIKDNNYFCSYTPVPGGVGLLTRVTLLSNLFKFTLDINDN